jgi:hypothetical protein
MDHVRQGGRRSQRRSGDVGRTPCSAVESYRQAYATAEKSCHTGEQQLLSCHAASCILTTPPTAFCFILQIQGARAVLTRIAPTALSLKTSYRSLRGQPRACPMESCLGSSGQRCIPWSLIQRHGHGTFGIPVKGSLPALPQSISTLRRSRQCRDFARCRPSQRSLFPPYPCKSTPSLSITYHRSSIEQSAPVR